MSSRRTGVRARPFLIQADDLAMEKIAMSLSKSQAIGIGVAVGAGIGSSLGVALHQIGPWIAIGVGIGMAIAIAIDERRSCAPTQSGKR